MKAMSLAATAPIDGAPLEVVRLSPPKPGPGELPIKVNMCGLCHTDLHIIEGDLALPRLPLVPGHQIVGKVAELGPGGGWPQIDQRIGVGWLHASCGECSYCATGRENLCANPRFTGYHVNGGYSEYAVARSDFVYSIPPGFSDEQVAPLLCGGVIGYRALRLSQVQPGQVLGLYGFGASAHIVIQVAKHWDCRVLVFTRSQAHQELATQLGAEWAGRAEDTAPEEPDASIIFAPAGSLVLPALGRPKRGGALVLAGITISPIPEMSYDLIYGERNLKSVANATRQDARNLLSLASEIPIKTRVEVFRLQEANQALQRLKKGELNGAGVLRAS